MIMQMSLVFISRRYNIWVDRPVLSAVSLLLRVRIVGPHSAAVPAEWLVSVKIWLALV